MCKHHETCEILVTFHFIVLMELPAHASMKTVSHFDDLSDKNFWKTSDLLFTTGVFVYYGHCTPVYDPSCLCIDCPNSVYREINFNFFLIFFTPLQQNLSLEMTSGHDWLTFKDSSTILCYEFTISQMFLLTETFKNLNRSESDITLVWSTLEP